MKRTSISPSKDKLFVTPPLRAAASFGSGGPFGCTVGYCSLRAQQHASPCSYCRNAVLQNTYGMPPYGGVCKLFSLNNRFADRTTHQIKTAGAAFFITAARLSLLSENTKLEKAPSVYNSFCSQFLYLSSCFFV